MEFEWDENKKQANFLKHEIDFEEATAIFDGRVVKFVSTKFDYGEIRIKAIGDLNGKVIAVIYTVRNGNYRIISARRADRNERRAYSQI
jgi:uncharacterized DUF497 family protein